MKIGIIGGTGGMGKGFALRWCKKHEIIIGSRDAERAITAAYEYLSLAKDAYGNINGTISGKDNLSVAKESDVLVLSIPYGNIDAICSQLLSEISDQCVVISPIVPMTKTDVGFECIAIKDNKAFSHQTVEKHMKDKTKLVSAFHEISEKKLVNPTLSLDYDIFVDGDDKDSVEVVNGLIIEIEGLRPIYLGPGVLSYLVEMSTPLLLNAMIRNKMKNPGIKLVLDIQIEKIVMSEEYPRRGRNWLTAMGVLFLVVATVTLVRDIIIWSPDFVFEFFFNSEINAQKVSLGAITFGAFMIVLGFTKKNVQAR